MPEVVVVDPDESEDEARRLGVLGTVAERDKAAVVRDGEHELRRDHDVAAPGRFLERDGGRARRDVARHDDPEFGHGCGVSASIRPCPRASIS